MTDGSTRAERDQISAEGIVSAPPEVVFAFLKDLENHWRLTDDRFVEVVSLEGAPGARSGGEVRLQGPLGLRRTVRTRVLETEPPLEIVGSAEIGRVTRASVRWSLRPSGAATTVRLCATVTRARVLDRLLLACGGRRWLRRRFATTLAHLAEQLGGQPQPVLLPQLEHV